MAPFWRTLYSKMNGDVLTHAVHQSEEHQKQLTSLSHCDAHDTLEDC